MSNKNQFLDWSGAQSCIKMTSLRFYKTLRVQRAFSLVYKAATIE